MGELLDDKEYTTSISPHTSPQKAIETPKRALVKTFAQK
jgi:hypothetical protein